MTLIILSYSAYFILLQFGESPFSWFLEFCWHPVFPTEHYRIEQIKRFISAGAEVSSTSTVRSNDLKDDWLKFS